MYPIHRRCLNTIGCLCLLLSQEYEQELGHTHTEFIENSAAARHTPTILPLFVQISFWEHARLFVCLWHWIYAMRIDLRASGIWFFIYVRERIAQCRNAR